MRAPGRGVAAVGVVLVLMAFFGYPCVDAQGDPETEALLRSIADRVVSADFCRLVDVNTGGRYSSVEQVPANAPLRLGSQYNDWRYWNGVLNIALSNLGSILGDTLYGTFARTNFAFAFDVFGYFERKYAGENKWEYPFAQFFIMEELDDCGAMAASLVEVVRQNPQSSYTEYLQKAALHVLYRQQRLTDSTLVRSFPRTSTLWADDLYMSVPFLARMGELTGDVRYFDDAALQVRRFHSHLFSSEKGLMHHCWYADVDRPGIAFWGRANGWAILAQLDLLDRLPMSSPHREEMLSLFRRHIAGITDYQTPDGMWHQLLDREGTFPETSCTAMFTYAIARGVRNGYLDRAYAGAARRGWEGIKRRVRPDGLIEGICTGTVVSDDLSYYADRPTPLNDVHGIGTVLLAGAEVLLLE